MVRVSRRKAHASSGWQALSTPQRIVALCGSLVLAASVTSGVSAFRRELSVVFQFAHQQQVPPILDQQLHQVRQLAPEGSKFLWVNEVPEEWFSKLWQRLLYPDPVFILHGETQLANTLPALREQFDIRYAFSAGSSPLDPGYKWYIRMDPPPGAQGELWFGELRDAGVSAIASGTPEERTR